jgi:hypothetical protein
VDLIPANSAHLWNANETAVSTLPGIKPSEAPAQEPMAIEALTLEQYHNICYWNLSQFRNFCYSTSATMDLNTIIAWTSGNQLEEMVGIALLPDAEVYPGDWRTASGATGGVMDGGWTWY